jgi:hypothetical protein
VKDRQHRELVALLTEIRDRLPAPERAEVQTATAVQSEMVRVARSFMAKEDLVRKLSGLEFVQEIAAKRLVPTEWIARILAPQLRKAGIGIVHQRGATVWTEDRR